MVGMITAPCDTQDTTPPGTNDHTVAGDGDTLTGIHNRSRRIQRASDGSMDGFRRDLLGTPPYIHLTPLEPQFRFGHKLLEI